MEDKIQKEVLDWYSAGDGIGLSAKYLANVSLEAELKEHNYPHDNSDFLRCVKFKEKCPNAFIKAKEILSDDRPFKNWGCNVAKVWQGYFKEWDNMEKLILEQSRGCNDGTELYNLMKQIQSESKD